MRFRCSGAMPEPESATTASTWPLTSVATRRRAAAGHGVFGVEQQVEKDLLQLAGVAVDGRQLLGQVEIDVESARS